MASRSLSFVVSFLILSIWAANQGDAAHHSAAAPSPAAGVDCTTLVLNMADCLSFVSAGSAVAKPEGSCCSGLKTVLKANAECLCEAFKSSASFGVTLNVTKALTLPTLCKVAAPPATNCALSPSPAVSPTGGMAPTAAADSPTGIFGSNEQAPSPGVSSSSRTFVSAGSLFAGFVLAALSGF